MSKQSPTSMVPPPQPRVRKKPYNEGRTRIERKAQTVQEERDEVIAMINAHIDKGINAADELLRLDKDKFFKFYKDVNQRLEACLDKLLCIKAQLADEDIETDAEHKSRQSSRSNSRQTARVSSRAEKSELPILSEDERALIERIKSQGAHKDSLIPVEGQLLFGQEAETDSIDSFEANESLIKELIRVQEEQLLGDSSQSSSKEVKGDGSDQIGHNSDPLMVKTEGEVSKVPLMSPNMKSFSNEDMQIRRHHEVEIHFDETVQNLGEGHDRAPRHSLPLSLSPLDVPRQEHRPSLTRTPELSQLAARLQSETEGPGQEPPEAGHTSQITAQSPTTAEEDNFDTASSEIYLSQENVFHEPKAPEPSHGLMKSATQPIPRSNFAQGSASSHHQTPPSPHGHHHGHAERSDAQPHLAPPTADFVGHAHVPLNCHVSVRISHINNPSDFYVHVNRDQVNGLYNEIQYQQEKYTQSNQLDPVTLAQLGSLYATRYSSDISWYRVEVIDVVSNSTKPIEVLFIDYGYTVKLNHTDLYPLCPTLATKPIQAIHCALRGVEGPSGSWTIKAVEEFKNSVSFYSIRAMFYEPVKSPKGHFRPLYPVDLYLDWGSEEMNNVLLYLSPAEFVTTSGRRTGTPKQSRPQSPSTPPSPAPPMPAAGHKDPPSLRPDLTKDAIAMDLKNNGLNKEHIKMSKESKFEPLPAACCRESVAIPRVPDKEYLLCVISHVVSPSEFYAHIISSDDEHNESQLDDLREQLNDHYMAQPSLPGQLVAARCDPSQLMGTFWAAIYQNDSSWYRVRIVELMSDESNLIEAVAINESNKKGTPTQAVVQYIDFGNIEVVRLDELRPLTSELAIVPALAVRCALANIRPTPGQAPGQPGDLWSEDCIRYFEDLSGFEHEAIVTAHVIFRPNRIDYDSVLSVLLWNSPDDGEGGGDILINAMLVRECLAITDSTDWIEEAELPIEQMQRPPMITMLGQTHKGVSEETDDCEESDFEEQMSQFPIERLPIGCIVLLQVTSAESPDLFYGTLPYGLETLDETGCESLTELIERATTAPHALRFNSLCADLQLKYGRVENIDRKKTLPDEGFFGLGSLIAFVEDDHSVHRARVSGYLVEDQLYRVQDLDTGRYKLIAKEATFPLGLEFCALPAYAVKCALANVEPSAGPDSAWSSEAMQIFKEHTENKSFAAHVIASDRGILYAELLGLEDDNSISVCEYLVSLGVARDALPAALSPAGPAGATAAPAATGQVLDLD